MFTPVCGDMIQFFWAFFSRWVAQTLTSPTRLSPSPKTNIFALKNVPVSPILFQVAPIFRGLVRFRKLLTNWQHKPTNLFGSKVSPDLLHPNLKNHLKVAVIGLGISGARCFSVVSFGCPNLTRKKNGLKHLHISARQTVKKIFVDDLILYILYAFVPSSITYRGTCLFPVFFSLNVAWGRLVEEDLSAEMMKLAQSTKVTGHRGCLDPLTF